MVLCGKAEIFYLGHSVLQKVLEQAAGWITFVFSAGIESPKIFFNSLEFGRDFSLGILLSK